MGVIYFTQYIYWGICMTDLEFMDLMNMQKLFVEKNCQLPNNGDTKIFDLISNDANEKFLLDVDRKGRIELSKFKLQNRYAQTKLPLVRIDIDSPPHMNPDGTKVSRNHIHIYKDMENDTGNLPWAYDLEGFDGVKFDSDNIQFMDVFISFCEYCHISIENIQGVM